MRAAGSNKARFTAGWIELSFSHDGLRDALTAIFKRRPTGQKLGLWLSNNIGEQSGQLTLLGRHSANAKAWRYAVIHSDDARLEAEAKAARVAALTLAAAERNRHAADWHNEQLAVQAAKNPAPAAVVVQIQAPLSMHNPYTSIVEERGYTVKPGVDGAPVKVPDLPTPKAAPALDTPTEEPKPASGAPVSAHGRRPTREELAARHRQEQTGSTDGGFYDPCGIVARNIQNESAPGRNYCRVVGVWPGYTGG